VPSPLVKAQCLDDILVTLFSEDTKVVPLDLPIDLVGSLFLQYLTRKFELQRLGAFRETET